jgi:hypothetical protein
MKSRRERNDDADLMISFVQENPGEISYVAHRVLQGPFDKIQMFGSAIAGGNLERNRPPVTYVLHATNDKFRC